MKTATAKCPTCRTAQEVEFNGADTCVETKECAGCGADLCEACDSFVCTGCDETFCAAHRVQYDKEICCPICAAWWAEDAKKKLHELFIERMEWRMSQKPATARRVA